MLRRYLFLLLLALVACTPRGVSPTSAPVAPAATSVAEPTSTSPAAPTPRETEPALPAATEPPPSSPTSAPTATPVPEPSEETGIPASSLFDVAWDDRSPFRANLIDDRAAVLDELPGATIYHIELRIGADLVQVEGREEVRYTNQEESPLSEIYFRLFPVIFGGSTQVASLTVNGQAVEPVYEVRDSALRVPLAEPLRPGEQVVIGLEFTVEVPDETGSNYGAFALVDGVLALAHLSPMIAVYDDEGWNVEYPPPNADVVYADSSFYLVRVSAPASQTVIGSGVEIDREEGGDEQVVTFAAGPVRDFYLVMSDRYTIASETVGQTVVNSYALPEMRDAAQLVLAHAADALQAYNDRFGVYPFTELDLVATPNDALGIEYPGVVVITFPLYDLSGETARFPVRPVLESTVAHEVAHQWFYSLVGNDQVDEPWLDEALTQYATLLYYEDLYGEAGAQDFHRSFESRWERVERADIPIGLPAGAYNAQEYSAIVYGRGPLFFETLAETMGQATFDRFLRDYVERNAWRVATVEGFKQLAEQHCGCDLTSLFEEWVYER